MRNALTSLPLVLQLAMLQVGQAQRDTCDALARGSSASSASSGPGDANRGRDTSSSRSLSQDSQSTANVGASLTSRKQKTAHFRKGHASYSGEPDNSSHRRYVESDNSLNDENSHGSRVIPNEEDGAILSFPVNSEEDRCASVANSGPLRAIGGGPNRCPSPTSISCSCSLDGVEGNAMAKDGGSKSCTAKRRRCGLCKPCLVTGDCGECRTCVNKVKLKQVCVHRKCEALKHRPALVAGNARAEEKVRINFYKLSTRTAL